MVRQFIFHIGRCSQEKKFDGDHCCKEWGLASPYVGVKNHD